MPTIFSCLSFADIGALRAVNRAFRQAGSDRDLAA